MFKQSFSSIAFGCDSQSAKEEHAPLKTHQRFCHDDTDLALWCCGEVGKKALEDILSRFAFRVNADGHHGWGTLLSLRTADWRDRGFTVSVPHGRGYRGKRRKTRWKTALLSPTLTNHTRDRPSHRQISQYRNTEKFPNMDIEFSTCWTFLREMSKGHQLALGLLFLSYCNTKQSVWKWKHHSRKRVFSFCSQDVINRQGEQISSARGHPPYHVDSFMVRWVDCSLPTASISAPFWHKSAKYSEVQ